MTDYITRDSGERQSFQSGARRDISTGKTRPDLIPPKARQRWGDLMARGAEKYGPKNWMLGMPMSRFLESAHRHLLAYELGDRGEDHLSGVLFNIGAMIHFENTQWDDINEQEDTPEVPLSNETFLETFWDTVDLPDADDQDADFDYTNHEKVQKDAGKDWSTGPGSPWNEG